MLFVTSPSTEAVFDPILVALNAMPRIALAPLGQHGFGYDPVFLPEGGTETFGEMDPTAKDAISHRTRAFTLLKAALID